MAECARERVSSVFQLAPDNDQNTMNQNTMQSNIENRTVYCTDNLIILQKTNSGCIDLIYLDPPFNTKKVFTAPLGTSAEGASFKDIFTQEDLKEEWLQTIQEDHFALYRLLEAVKEIEGRTSYNFCYLAYMAIRLIECHRVLKETGSLYLHCDPTMSHYLKLVLDCLFGEGNFRNEIIWSYASGGASTRHFSKKHDTIYMYSKTDRYIFNVQKDKSYIKGKFGFKEAQHVLHKDEKGWFTDINMRDVWQLDIVGRSSSERTGYPTQKPLALLERIITASSNKDDVVLDPFCGCATTCVAAEKLHRKWIGIDISIKAYELVQTRLKDEVYAEGLVKGEKGTLPQIHFKTTPPQRTDDGAETTDHKYIYVISHPQYPGEYKVGVARDAKSRLKSYHTGDPNRAYTLEYSLRTEHYRPLERHIHQTFERRHEWVRAPLQDIIEEIKSYRPQ